MLKGLIAFLLIVLIGGCASADQPPATETTETTAMSVTPQGELKGRISMVGSTTVQPLVEAMGTVYNNIHPDVQLDIGAGGSVVGIQAVQKGDVDIGMSSRHLDDEEILAGMELHQIAIDVLAVIVHPDNPVDDLSLEQLRAIYLGEVTNWQAVGGEDMPILPVVREVTSGTRGAFDEIVLDDQQPDESVVDVQITAGEVERKVATTPNAIGYIGFGHINPDEIKVLTIDEIVPSPETALDQSYTLQRPLLLITGSLSRHLAQNFVDFALSPEGQQIVAREGWVPVIDVEE
ncbi:MAG: phosphate ABC transporter substrate-binding protein [Chloroflexaceae bacterium]|nr:phosphate ABC transporter substrate-binding protein [Chloroflexaceae bacterium]